MKRRKKYRKYLCFMSVCLTVFFGFTASLSAQISFSKHFIPLDSAERKTVLTGFLFGGEIADVAVVKVDENNERHLRIYSFENREWKPKLETKLRSGVQFVDVVNIGGRDRLVTYAPDQLSWFDTESLTEKELLKVKTDFDSSHKDEILHIDISRDLNGDNLDDLAIPNAGGFSVFIQMKNGTFANPLKFKKSTDTDMYRYNPWFFGRIHEVDYNGDGHRDLVYWDKDLFRVHLQNESGLFSESTETFTTEVEFDSDDINTLAAPFGVTRRKKDTEPEGKLTGRVLHSLTDINGDGVADMVIFSLQGGSLFKMYSTYEVHFGTPTSDGGTTFDKNIGAVIRSEGIPFGVEKHDFDGDGQSGVMFTTINPSFFKVARMMVGWFFTRSVSLEVNLYRMKEGNYPHKPTFKRKIKTLSLGGKGEEAAKFPAILFGDFNGDQRTDMLMQKGKKQLLIFAGEPQPNLFARRPQKIKVALPKNKKYIWLKDLNNDGRQDILMYHKPTRKSPRLTILLAQ